MRRSTLGIVALLIVGCGATVETTQQGNGGAGSTGATTATGVQSGVGSTSSVSTGSGAGPSSSASSVASSTATGPTCPQPCPYGCCGSTCFDFTNDPYNCGSCGTTCPGPHPFCHIGTCTTPSCYSGTTCSGAEQCCGSECCGQNEICCLLAFGEGEWIGCVPTSQGTCPVHQSTVCASPDTPIATPDGERAIATLVPGDLVYSLDGAQVRAVPILGVHRTAAHDHRVVRVVLDGGATLEISPNHPTADGRPFGSLRLGDRLDGQRVLEVSLVPYASAFTYDILPDSDTATYYAGGARIGTTMRSERARGGSSSPIGARDP